ALVGGDHMNLLVLAADIGKQESPDPVSLVLLEQSRGPSGPARRWTADVDVPTCPSSRRTRRSAAPVPRPAVPRASPRAHACLAPQEVHRGVGSNRQGEGPE